MTPKQITIVIIRLLLLYATLRVSGSLLAVLLGASSPTSFDETPLQQAALFGVIFVVWLFVCLLLWKLSPKIATWLLPEQLAEPQPLPRTPEIWLNSGLVLMGIWLLATSIGSLGSGLAQMLFWTQGDSSFITFHLLPYAIPTLFGLLLCLKPLWVSRLIRRVIS